jgi:hypothetical protein
MAGNALNIRILKFYTKAREKESDIAWQNPDTGLPELEDWVSYCPTGQANMLVVNEAIKRIDRVAPGAVDNPAVQAARAIRDYIMPKYEAWRKHEEIPLDGTPLAIGTFFREEDVEAIKKAGIRTIEEFATLPDSARDKIQAPRVRELQAQAVRFLNAKDQNAAAARAKVHEDTIAKQGEELATLRAQMEALLASQVAPPADGEVKRGRGRPPKQHEDAEAA